MVGGNYVNRFSIAGRSYEVIPQVTRTERLNPDQLENFYVSGPKGKLVPLSTFAHIETTAEPRSLSRFQQLNSVKISGRAHAAAGRDARRRAQGDGGRGGKAILPRGYTIDYAGASRQLRVEGSKFLPLLVLSLILIFLVLAAQFESFSDPLIILLGSVPLALTGALIFSFLGETSLNIYANVGLVTLVGLVSKNGILIVEFANTLQERGYDKFQAIVEGSLDTVAADPDDLGGDGGGPRAADLCDGSGRGRAQLDWLDRGDGDDHRDGVHIVRGADVLHAAGAGPQRGCICTARWTREEWTSRKRAST